MLPRIVFAAAAITAAAFAFAGNANADSKTVIIRDNGFARKVVVVNRDDDGNVTDVRRKFQDAFGRECRSRTSIDDDGRSTVRRCNF